MFSSQREIGFIQFDVRKFKIINDLYGERFGDQILEFIIRQLEENCQEGQFFVNLRSDVFMVVMEYDLEQDLVDFIENLDSKISCYKDVKLQMCYGCLYCGI